MKRSFMKTLGGKFVSRTVLLVLAIALVVGGLAIVSLRSLTGTANSSVESARTQLSPEAVAHVQALADDISSTSTTLTMLFVLITIAGAVFAGAMAYIFAKKITSPIIWLRNAVMKSAEMLPELAEASANGDAELPELPRIALRTGDEVEDLATSFNQVQQTAADLAIKQAQTRQHSAERFVNLGRRSQNLLERQMSLIDSMEKDETNPDNLQRLFQIDHLATRMRRNAESTLVLADKVSPRRLRRPVSMHQVVQAASGEIEHFERINISDISGASVDGSAASDVAHLLAELLENATSFASPDANTTVKGRPTPEGYQLEVIDNGIGMEAGAMTAANARFADTTGESDHLHSPSYLGHDVVARLARRHGVGVELTNTAGSGGVTARLSIPKAVLSSGEDVAAAPQPVAAAEPAAASPGEPAFSAHVETMPDQTPHDATVVEAALPQTPTMHVEPAHVEPLAEETPAFSAHVETMPDQEPHSVPAPAALQDDISMLTAPLPDLDMPDVTIPDIDMPDVTMPDIDMPDIATGLTMPDIDMPDIATALTMPDIDMPDIDMPDIAAGLTTPDITMPDIAAGLTTPDITMPDIDMPDIDMSEVGAPLTDADIEAFTNSAIADEAAALAEQTEPMSAPEPTPVVEPIAEATAAVEEEDEEDDDDWVYRGLSEEQRAAIAWAMERGGDLSTVAQRTPVAVGAVSDATELAAGPMDASSLVELAPTASGFQRRRRGEHNAQFTAPPAEASKVKTPRNAESLMAFRQGIASGRAKAAEYNNDGDV